jgi:hypothetical protein
VKDAIQLVDVLQRELIASLSNKSDQDHFQTLMDRRRTKDKADKVSNNPQSPSINNNTLASQWTRMGS